ncbi:hypothetical protein [Alteribacillus sp. YIM 98480]|uniref:hypothetical protein n=1 Tax=Alteribacillus sp. YIM 98480 TaxID=2606599 RepID=UPI00131D9B98|nr:hypothetical protein [Alteribacillus sp. YIM 98480]
MKDIALHGLLALFIGCNFTILLFVLFHVRKIAKLQAHLEIQLQTLHKNKEIQDNKELKEEMRHHLHMQ